MELKIYKQDSSVRKVVSPSDSSVITEEVGGVCSVSLNFEDFEFYAIEVNDYIEVDGVRYKNNAAYRPKMKNRQTYSYALTFFAPIHDAERILMKTEQNSKLESEFSLWGGPREHLQKWVDNMNRAAGSAIWSIGSVITSDNKNIEYRNLSCWDAAFGSNGIAATFGTEMWADGYVVNLCKCERGERVTLGYNNGLTSLLPENNSDKVRFFTRLYPLGSTRNINVSEYGSARLQLPSKAKYVDRNTDRFGIIEATEEAAFAAIYPCYMGTVSAVRSESKTDENGKQFTVYYIKDDKLTWTPEALPGQSFMLSFQSGDLQGYGDNQNKSFQANWHDDTKEWEIINIWLDENTQVPGGNIVPEVGNKYFPWNMIMPKEYITEAEKRLETAVNDYMASYSVEPVSYKGNTDYIHCDRVHVPLAIGQNVRLESDLYFAEGYLNTRITKVTRKLCRPSDASVTFADKTGTGWKKSVDNQLSSLHYELQKQSEQPGIDIVKTTDSKTPSDNNVFSALRSLATFLRKDKTDSTSHLLTLLAGAVFGENKASIGADGVAKFVSMIINEGKASITKDGVAQFLSAVFNGGKASIDADGLLTAVNAIIKGDIKSDNFLAGALGSGYAILKKDADGKSYLEVDKIFARVKAIFAVLEIMKVTYTGGNFVFSPAGMNCTKVEEYDTYYRCYFTADDGEKAVENTFEVDDFVQLREFNVKPGVYENVSNRYFWRRCIAKGSDYIDLSKSDRDMTSDDAPMAGDCLVTIGNKTTKSRQNVIIISVYGEGSPSIIQYAGISDYSLDGKAVTVISPNGNKFTGSFVIEATGKSVEDEISASVEVASAAKKAADQAQKDADKANTELNTIASDNYITPSEKTALKQQQADIQAERNEIVANATKYGVSHTAYDAAYTLANNALTKYTASNPKNIGVESDYANISAYYAARKFILDAIATAAKKLVDDVNNDLQGYKKTVTQEFKLADGRLSSAITETKTYADQAVQAMPISGKNLFRDTKEGGHWYPNNWGGSDFSVEKITEAVTVGGHALNGYVRFLRNGTQGNGDIKTIADYSPKITKADTRNRYVTVSFYARAEQRTAIYLSLCSGGNGEIAAEGEINKEAIISTEWEYKSVTFKTKDEPQYDGLWVWWSWYDAGIPLDMALFQVEFGNRASEWSPSADDVMDYTDQQIGKIPYSGRNLLQMWSMTEANLVPENGEWEENHSELDYTCDFIPVQPNEQLTLSLHRNIDRTADYFCGRFWAYNANKVGIQSLITNINWDRNGQMQTVITPEGTAFVRLSLIRGKEKNTWKLERGTKVTDWTPAPEDTAALIEQNASEIKQLPDSITFSVSKKITGGALNYVSGTQGNHETTTWRDENNAEDFGGKFKIHKECGGKYLSAAFKVRFEGCEFGGNPRVKMQVNDQNGWGWYELVANEGRNGSGFALSDRGETFPLDGGLTIPYNGEFVIYSYDLAKPGIQGDGVVFVRFDYVRGGKITVSEIRVWETTDEERNAVNKEPLPWYPSRWDTGLLDSKITQTAESITLEVENRKSEDEVLSSRIQQTADQISLKVNEVIGGENLIDGASFLDDGGLIGWSIQGNMTAKIVYNEAKLGKEKCLELYLMEKGCGIWKAISPKGAAVMGDEVTYTISFDLYRGYDEPTFIQIGMQEEYMQNMDISQVPLGQWKRVSFKRTIGKHQRSIFGMYFYPNADGLIYVKRLKVELGSKATEWTESDRDVLLSTGIDITNKSIVLTAENTVIQSSNGQRVAMFETDSEGKPWIRGENVDATNLTAQKIITRRDNGARVEIADSEINIFGDVARNIQFGVDEDGYAALRYFDNEGKLLYKLGFNGLVQKPSRPESWSSTWLYKTGDTELQAYNDGKYKDWVYKTENQRYIYNCEIKEGVYMDEVNDGRTTTQKFKSPSFRLNGWYVKAPSRSGESHNWTEIERLDPNNPGGEIRLPGMSAAHPPVYNRKPLYMTQMYLYKDGIRIKTHNVYFNG